MNGRTYPKINEKARCPDNNNPSNHNHIDLSISDDNASKVLSPVISILGVLWIILLDLVPGPVDDLFVLLFLAFSNPGIGAFLGDAIKALISMAALAWIAMPDICPGPVDDFLLVILILNLLPKPRSR